MSYQESHGYNQVRNNSYAWRMLVAQLKAMPGSNICWSCGKQIDMKLPNNHPMQWTADHVQSMVNSGEALSLANLRPAHRSCNSKRGRMVMEQRSSRDW